MIGSLKKSMSLTFLVMLLFVFSDLKANIVESLIIGTPAAALFYSFYQGAHGASLPHVLAYTVPAGAAEGAIALGGLMYAISGGEQSKSDTVKKISAGGLVGAGAFAGMCTVSWAMGAAIQAYVQSQINNR